MGARILFVEDDAQFGPAVRGAAQVRGFHLEIAGTLREARLQLARQRHDLLLCDRILPDGDGLDLCRRLREQRSTVPIVMLTARDASEEILEGFAAGCDAYLGKPLDPPVLFAWVDRMLHRARPPVEVQLRALSKGACVAIADEESFEPTLTPMEAKLLALLVATPGIVISREELVDKLWPVRDVNPNTLDALALRLRIKLGPEARLVTLRGRGLMLDVQRPTEARSA